MSPKYSHTFLLIITFFISFVYGFGQKPEQFKKYLFTGKKSNVPQLIEIIESNTDVIINYSPGQINSGAMVDFDKTESTVEDILNAIITSEKLELIKNGNNVYLIKNLKQNNFHEISLSGYLKDFETGEALIGATIRTKDMQFGQFSDHKGYFNLKIPRESEAVIISYIGYSSLSIAGKNLKSGILGDIYLKHAIVLDQVIISDSILNNEPQTGDFQRQKFTSDLDRNITKYGINDVFNELIMKPGVNRINDFQGGISVNGASPGDNIYYLDGIRIFEPNHIFGLFSSFSSKPINNVSFFTNSIPLNYSGAFSSVLDFHTRDGNYRKPEFEFGISNSAANFFLTGPLKKYTTSYFLDYRHSLIGLYLPNIIRKYNYLDFNKLFFNDLNVKLTHKINQFNRISVFYYKGTDHVNVLNKSKKIVNSENDFSWQNHTTGLSWTFIYKGDFKSDLSVSTAEYSNDSYSGFELFEVDSHKQFLNIYSSTTLREISIKHDITYFLKKSRIKFGSNLTNYNVSPILGSFISQTNEEKINIEHEKDSILNNSMAYLSGEFYLSGNFELKTGMQIGLVYNKNYTSEYLNPQIALSYKAGKNTYVDLAYSRTNKFIHSMGSYAVGIPSMIWSISGNGIPVSVMNNLSINLMYRRQPLRCRVEFYYRLMNDIVMYKNIIDAYNPVATKNTIIPVMQAHSSVGDNIAIGEANGYGLNLLSAYNSSKMETSFTFSINKMNERYDDLNRAKFFSGKYDMDYSLALSLAYKLRHLNLFASWNYHSGQVFTLPKFLFNDSSGEEILDFSEMNNARLDSYHSLDIGMNHTMPFKKWKLKTSLGVTNIYNHFNPVYAYVLREDNVYKASQVGGIPLNPYFSLEVKF